MMTVTSCVCTFDEWLHDYVMMTVASCVCTFLCCSRMSISLGGLDVSSISKALVFEHIKGTCFPAYQRHFFSPSVLLCWFTSLTRSFCLLVKEFTVLGTKLTPLFFTNMGSSHPSF